MVKPISQPRTYEGYGSGAATPDSSRLAPRVPKSSTRNINAPQQAAKQGWKPSVSRTRPDLPKNPPAKESRVATPKAAPAIKPAGARKPRGAANPAAAAAQAANAGVSRSRAVVPVGDQRMTVDGKATEVKKPGRFGLPKTASGWAGASFMAASNAILIGTTVSTIANSQQEAEAMWENDPSLKIRYASPEDLARDISGSAVAQAVGGLVDTAAMGIVQRGAASLLAPLIGAGPAGWIAMGIAFFALPIILDAFTSGEPNTNPGAEIEVLAGQAMEEGVDSVPLGPVEAPTAALGAAGTALRYGAAYYTSVYGMNFGDSVYRSTPISDLIRTFGWDTAKVRTPDQKQALRMEMGAQQWYTENGPMITYKSFGPRKEEVKAVLGQGFFLTPTTATQEIVTGGKKQVVRTFLFDYAAFTDWFEKTMWIAGVSNDPESIKAQTRMLPPLNERTTAEITMAKPLTDAEIRQLFLTQYEGLEQYAIKAEE
jgi:hypothetical protein